MPATPTKHRTPLSGKLAFLTEGRSRAHLSRAAGLPPNAISDYINKGYIPRMDTAFALAKVLGVSLDWLADDQQGLPLPGLSDLIGDAEKARDRLNAAIKAARHTEPKAA